MTVEEKFRGMALYRNLAFVGLGSEPHLGFLNGARQILGLPELSEAKFELMVEQAKRRSAY